MKALTTTQRKILTAAAKQPKLPIEEHMGRIKGGVAVHRQIAYSLLNSGYVSEDGDCHYITDEGVAALSAKKAKLAKAEKNGKQKPAKEAKAKKPAAAKAKKPSKKAKAADTEATGAEDNVPSKSVTATEGDKPAQGRQLLINMLSTDEGATIQQMVDATGWQSGAISGTMSKIKKLIAPNNQGITFSKVAGGKAVYRIVDLDAKQAADDDTQVEKQTTETITLLPSSGCNSATATYAGHHCMPRIFLSLMPHTI